MFLPFFLGVLHRYGWFNWIKKEWVTFGYWKRRFLRWYSGEPDPRQQKQQEQSEPLAVKGNRLPEGSVCTPDGCCYLPEETSGGGRGLPEEDGKQVGYHVSLTSPLPLPRLFLLKLF
jgi:hypothetical protein